MKAIGLGVAVALAAGASIWAAQLFYRHFYGRWRYFAPTGQDKD